MSDSTLTLQSSGSSISVIGPSVLPDMADAAYSDDSSAAPRDQRETCRLALSARLRDRDRDIMQASDSTNLVRCSFTPLPTRRGGRGCSLVDPADRAQLPEVRRPHMSAPGEQVVDLHRRTSAQAVVEATITRRKTAHATALASDERMLKALSNAFEAAQQPLSAHWEGSRLSQLQTVVGMCEDGILLRSMNTGRYIVNKKLAAVEHNTLFRPRSQSLDTRASDVTLEGGGKQQAGQAQQAEQERARINKEKREQAINTPSGLYSATATAHMI